MSERYEAWSDFLQKTRRYFIEAGFIEVTTPIMVEAGAFESSLDCLSATWSGGSAELHTSPEIEMKKLLGKVKRPIFQITRCFRDDPHTKIHRREFTMLEYYEPNKTYETLIARTQGLFEALSPKPLEFKTLTVKEAFLETTGIDIAAPEDSLRRAIENQKLIQIDTNDTWDDMYFKLMLEKVEPSFDPNVVTILKNYPASQAALAALEPKGPFAERFEFYFHGIELCNGCTELKSGAELRRRHEVETSKRAARGKAPHTLPSDFVDAIDAMPPAAGVAVGMDRLFLCLHDFELL